MSDVVISGTGLYTPSQSVSNDELVTAFNTFVDQYNRQHATDIEQGHVQALAHSDADFIKKASGIESRYVLEKSGILDPTVMKPQIPARANEELALLAEIAVAAAKDALQQADRSASDIDAVIVSCANLQRAYPAIAIEVQQALGIEGFGFDMNVACSSVTFGLQTAYQMVRSETANRVLVINPEFTTAHLNFRDRDSHFIFGDVATASLVERKDEAHSSQAFEIISTRCKTEFSNAIRNNFGFMNRTEPDYDPDRPDYLFVQQGRRVFKEVSPAVVDLISNHLDSLGLSVHDLKRFWLHQANINMNNLIIKRLLGREATQEEAPNILSEYGNTASAGSLIAFHKTKADFNPGDKGLLCSFGAGYSIGNIILEKC